MFFPISKFKSDLKILFRQKNENTFADNTTLGQRTKGIVSWLEFYREGGMLVMSLFGTH
jgi:hypothetical protein